MYAPFPISLVRQVATQCGLDEIYLNEESKVISFCSSSRKRSLDVGSTPTRHNVYYTTGTVSTSLDHPRQGKTQLFRRNVDIDLMRNIFLNPRMHTDFGYQQISTSNKHQMIDNQIRMNREIKNEQGEEEAAKLQMQKLLDEKAAIEKEMEECQAIIDCHEKERQEKAKKEAEEKERQRKAEKQAQLEAEQEEKRLCLLTERRARGTGASWCGLRESDNFKKNFRNDTTCVAIEGDRHLCLYENGGWAYNSGLITNLHKKLHTRALSHPSLDYVAMGSHNRYYVCFKNGKSEWVGPDALSDLLQKNNKRVKTVAFGESFLSYFVVFEDGCWQYGGGCPYSLVQKIEARKKRADLDRVSLGPNGEWFLSAKNGRTWWGDCSTALRSKAQDLMNKGRNITDIQFGDNDAYFIRFS